jgi:hypothetical protein
LCTMSQLAVPSSPLPPPPTDPQPGGARSVERRKVLIVAVVVVLPVVAVVGNFVYMVLINGSPSPETLRALQAEGKAMVDAVERYKSQHGRYPPSLAEAGVSTPLTRYGWWRYGSDGSDYSLELGDYGRYGFLMWWMGDGWDVDT